MHTAKSLEEQLQRVLELETKLTFRISLLSKLLDQRASSMLDGSGINLTSYKILVVISTLERGSISDISRFCGIDRAQVSRSAMELEKRRCVEFKDDPVSRRKKIVVISPEGEELLSRLRPSFSDWNKELDGVLGPDRRAALIEAVNCLTNHIMR